MNTLEIRSRLPLLALVAANAVSLAGNVMATVAVPWFVLVTTGSAAKTGIAAFFTTLPLALGAVVGGTIADRVGHRTTAVLSDVGGATAIAAVPLLHALDELRFPYLLALVFVTSLFDGPGQAAREALLPELAERSGRPLERATSLWVSTEHVAYVVGAPLAGLLIAVIGAPNVLWIDAASFVSAATLVALWVPRVTPHGRLPQAYLADLRAGLRFILRDPIIRNFLVIASLGNMLAAPLAFVFLPVYANEVLESAVALGFLMAAYGIGGITNAVLLEPLVRLFGRRTTYVVAWLSWAALYFVVAALPPLWVMAVALFATAIGGAGAIEALIRQERTPPELRARVFATQMAALAITAPLGALLGGFAVDAFGLRDGILVIAVANAFLAAGAVLSPAVRRL